MLVENVKGFETSAMRDELIRVLASLDFHYQVHTSYTVVFEFDALFHRLASQQLLHFV